MPFGEFIMRAKKYREDELRRRDEEKFQKYLQTDFGKLTSEQFKYKPFSLEDLDGL